MSTLDRCFWGYGYAWNRQSHYDDDATISYNNENRNSLGGSSPFKADIERAGAAVVSTITSVIYIEA